MRRLLARVYLGRCDLCLHSGAVHDGTLPFVNGSLGWRAQVAYKWTDLQGYSHGELVLPFPFDEKKIRLRFFFIS
jgi:hypothetical protein